MATNYLIPVNESGNINLDELMEQDPTLLKILAGRSDTHPIVLAHLACSRDKTIRKAVAANAATPSDILNVLADDNETIVYCAVAANPSAPVAVLKKFVEGGSYAALPALKNPSTPVRSIIYRMLKKLPEDERAAVGLNERFSDLVRAAAKMDEDSAHSPKLMELDASEFDSDDDHAGSQWQ